MSVVILSHKVGIPLKNHRSTEFIGRIPLFAKRFNRVYILCHIESNSSSYKILNDPDFQSVSIIEIGGSLFFRQVITDYLIRKLIPSVIYIDTFTDANNALLHIMLSKIPIVTTLRGWDKQVIESEMKLKGMLVSFLLVKLFWPLRDFFLLKRSQAVITVTRGLARYAEINIGRDSRSRVFTVFRSLRYTQMIDDESKLWAKNLVAEISSQLKNAPKLITTVGRLSPGKRVDLAIASFALLVKELPSVFLMILGDGPERARLEHLTKRLGLEDRVLFLSRISRVKVLALLEISELMVFPSISEGFAKAPHEALAVGCPVVCHKFQGSEGLGFHDACVIVESNNASDYCTAMLKVLSDNTFRNNLVRRGYALTKKYMAHSNEERVNMILDIMSNIIE